MLSDTPFLDHRGGYIIYDNIIIYVLDSAKSRDQPARASQRKGGVVSSPDQTPPSYEEKRREARAGWSRD